jgi:hypothetical protein
MEENMSIQMKIEDLIPHPKNYREHPKAQIEHLKESIAKFGFYKNVVISQDNYILAGHGVCKAATELGIASIPVIELKLNHNDPKALKVVAGDNEIGRLGEVNDRALTEILKEIQETDIEALVGTGFDDQMLAALIIATRGADEIPDFDAAAEWVGMPEFEAGEKSTVLYVHFNSIEDKMKFQDVVNIRYTKKTKSIHWPDNERNDLAAAQYK